MRSPIAWALALACAMSSRPSPAQPPVGDGEPLLDEIRSQFPAARKWFGMVADLAWTRDGDGTLTPRPDGMRSRFVLASDGAQQRLGVRLPPRASGPHEVWLDGDSALSVRTEEVGIRPVAAEVVRGMVVYRGAVAGGDLLYKFTPTHVDEYIYFRDPPSGLRREFDFDTGGAVGKLREAGRLIEVLGKDGQARLRLSAPVARAADGTRRTGDVFVEGSRIIEEIDLRGLVAPILVDPDWQTTGTMTVAHWADAAYRMPDERVMAVGGCALASCPLGLATSACSQVLSSTDVWSPSSGTWTAGPSLGTARYSFAGVPLAGGDFLVAGGCVATGCTATTRVAERFSVAQGRFVSVGAMPRAGANQSGALLPGGDALVPGGCDEKACFPDVARFRVATNDWVATTPLPGPRGYATTTALADGTVLVLGGCLDNACATVLADAARFDPATNQWSFAGAMSTPRAGHTATLLDDGTVLVAGGCSSQPCQSTTLDTAELWHPDAGGGGHFTPATTMNAPRHHHTATRLDTGEVLLAGGADGSDATRAASEVYLPHAGRFLEAPRMMMSRAYHVGVGLANGEVLVAGGCNPATCLPWAEVFDPTGLPVDNPDGGVDGGALDMTPPGPVDWGAPFAVRGGPHPKLFRTGATSCATDDAQDLVCPVAGWPAQDGELQPDVRPMKPVGDGTVQDPVTGLTWQAQDDGKAYANADAQAICAGLALAGGGWRLPSVVELMTLLNYASSLPSIDQAFTGTQSTNYWTATRVAGSQLLAWTVKFDAGEVVPLLADTTLPVRCVRGAMTTASAGGGHLRLAGPLTATDDTVRDVANGIEWQRRDDGQKHSWREALDTCAHADTGGHADWHLPNTFELLALVEYGDAGPVKIDPAFEGAHPDIYWTSTFNEGVPTLSWGITFNLGVVDGVTVSGGGYARCVRHLQPGDLQSGCGCAVGRAPTGNGLALALGLGLVLVLLRRRRR